MSAKSPLPDILEAIHENQLALADAIESVGLWIDQRCGTEVSSTILGAVATIDVNAERIRASIDALKRLDSGFSEGT